MVERPHDGPLPPARPVPYGRPPLPDGDRIPVPARRVPLTRRERVYAVLLVLVALAGWMLGALRR